MTAPRVLFLDIDGVLNGTVWAACHPPLTLLPPTSAAEALAEQRLDPVAVARLADLTRSTGAAIVLASSWRHRMPRAELVRLLAGLGFPDAPVIGETPSRPGPRGAEIAAWLGRQSPVPSTYVCLDDGDDYLPEQPLVQTHPDRGLTDADVALARRRLRRDPPGA